MDGLGHAGQADESGQADGLGQSGQFDIISEQSGWFGQDGQAGQADGLGQAGQFDIGVMPDSAVSIFGSDPNLFKRDASTTSSSLLSVTDFELIRPCSRVRSIASRRFCMFDSVTGIEASDVVWTWKKTKPVVITTATTATVVAALLAIMEADPCKLSLVYSSVLYYDRRNVRG